MSKRIFTKEQIKELLQNPNIVSCSEKSISYHKDFKISAIKKYQKGLTSSEIFKQALFDMDIIGCKIPSICLRRWRKTFKNKGKAGLKSDGRGKSKGAGGRPRSLVNILVALTDKEKLKRLEIEVAYLKEENHFLAKLRKKSLN